MQNTEAELGFHNPKEVKPERYPEHPPVPPFHHMAQHWVDDNWICGICTWKCLFISVQVSSIPSLRCTPRVPETLERRFWSVRNPVLIWHLPLGWVKPLRELEKVTQTSEVEPIRCWWGWALGVVAPGSVSWVFSVWIPSLSPNSCSCRSFSSCLPAKSRGHSCIWGFPDTAHLPGSLACNVYIVCTLV